MIKQIRFHNWRGPFRDFYFCGGETLYKPKRTGNHDLDIQDEHLAFLSAKRTPVTYREKRIHALLVHENTHSERARQMWPWMWRLRYHLSRSFRLEEEKAAYQAEIAQLAAYRIPVLITHIARALSGPVYRHMVSYDDALGWVRETVKKEGDFEYVIDSMVADEHIKNNRRSSTIFGEVISARSELQDRTAWVKDRIALLMTGIVVFVVLFLIVGGIELGRSL